MEFEGVCLNCFSQRGEYEVCPYCGYLAGTVPAEGYILQPGSRLWGRYVVGTVLGAGGFGITYRAWDTRLKAMVAIKEFFSQSLVSRMPGEGKVRVFSGDRQEAYAQQLGRFVDEAKNLAKFAGDEHIVNVLDFFEDNGTAYIVMEYLDGVTLKEYIAMQGGRLPLEQALAIEGNLLKALGSIHSKGIIHRDISPDNIFILQDGGMKVLDFGAARFALREESAFTQGVVVKKGYAPPEQYRTNMKQGIWTDIYAAGATLYKMVTGITPEESIERTEKDQLKRPSQTGRAVDAAVDKAVMKAMALRPELRFKSADAMLAALENRTVVDFPEEELKKRGKRNRILMVASILIVLGLAVLVAVQASKTPLVTGGSPLMKIEAEPDTITVFLSEYENEAGEYDQLAVEFMEEYPQHKVVLETYKWTENMVTDLIPRFTSPEAPAVFGIWLDLEQEETPYMADLTPLVKALNTQQYVLLEEHIKDYTESDESGAGKGEPLYNIPTGFTFDMVYGSPKAAADRGLTLPEALTSYEEIVAWEREMPGTVYMEPYELSSVMGCLRPEIGRERDIQALEDAVGEYARMYMAGYFDRNGGYNSSYISYTHAGSMLEMENWSGTESIRRQPEGWVILPLTYEGKIVCNTSNQFSVSSFVSENQQKVGMLFLGFMLSERGQSILHLQNDGIQPLHKNALKQYMEANPRLAFLGEKDFANLTTEGYGYYIPELADLLQENRTTIDSMSRDSQVTEAQIEAELDRLEEEVRAMVRAEYETRWSEE